MEKSGISVGSLPTDHRFESCSRYLRAGTSPGGLRWFIPISMVSSILTPAICRSSPIGRGVRFKPERFRVRISGAALLRVRSLDGETNVQKAPAFQAEDRRFESGRAHFGETYIALCHRGVH